MGSDEDIDELKTKRLCYQCVGEQYLMTEMRRKGKRGKCSYCGRSIRSYTIEEIAESVETAFEQHFRRTSDEPNYWQQSMHSDPESTYDWDRDGEPVVWAIENAAEIPEQAAQDIQAILEDKHGDLEAAKMGEETEFSSESYYEEKDPSDHTWQENWRYFGRSLKTEARFFSRSAATYLASIFNAIDKMSTTDGRPLVVDAGPQTALTEVFRARVFQSDERLLEAISRPDHHIGSPPAILAVAGRMNAHGISVFYGASSPDVALAEVRPPVGSQVTVGRFDIVRPLRLLDLTTLSTVTEDGSIFDPGWAARLDRATFLRSLSQHITKPVMPDDEAFEYLSTQAIADFLATENVPLLDGIVFPSVQVAGDGLNVVLFHKGARVEAMEIPAGTEINAQTGSMNEDGWEVDYWVSEQVLPKEKKKDEQDEGFAETAFVGGEWRAHDADIRDTTLRIDIESVKVHIVRSVQFQCETHDVSRYRREKRNTKF
ncbi:RES domain-containing protein [Nitrosomonas ureae]|uniref:RES domain-containing protein n=1 Tax=Nitrosomonas ureae TaxID=44577 RepID=A0A286ALH7_9PROT|nr:RES domain-containing protein [Nitrosomonas ureae]SOD22758.1 RES domain-containing protein [Nitrosomonas ureae]